MKSNWFKYIFIFFIIIILIFAIYKIRKDEEIKQQEQQITSTEQEKVRELKLGIAEMDTINPILSNNKNVQDITRLIYEPLVNITSDYKAEQCLAKEWAKQSDNSYLIKLRENVKWSAGQQFTAEDVRFTIDKLKEVQSVYSYNVQYVVGVDIVDDYTVRINLDREVPFFEYNLTFPIVSNNYYIGEDFYESTKMPMGTGMYKISKLEANNIVLEKNDKWWNKEKQDAKIEKIDIKIFSEIGELYNSFKLGNIDIFTTSNNNLENYIGTIGYAKCEYGGREFDYLAFNCEDNILKNIEVRKAIGYGLDKTALITSVYNNNKYISNFPIDYGNYLYTENMASLGYNEEQAKKVLEENGWIYKNNRWQKQENYRTNRISLNLTVNKEDENRVKVAEFIKQELGKIGINININKVTKANYDTILQNKNYQMILTGVYNSYSPNVETFLESGNLQNYNNEELNTIITDVKNIKDENLLKEKYNRIIEIYNNDMPFISLYRNKGTVVRSQNLAGEITPNNYFSYYNFYSWSRM